MSNHYDDELEEYAQSIAQRTAAREERLKRLAMLKRQQLENDEEEIQKSVKKLASSTNSVISSSCSFIKSTERKSVSTYNSPVKQQFLPTFSSPQKQYLPSYGSPKKQQFLPSFGSPQKQESLSSYGSPQKQESLSSYGSPHKQESYESPQKPATIISVSPSKESFNNSLNSPSKTTTPLQSSTNLFNSFICSPQPYQKSPVIIKSPLKSFMCPSPSQVKISSNFDKKIIDFSPLDNKMTENIKPENKESENKTPETTFENNSPVKSISSNEGKTLFKTSSQNNSNNTTPCVSPVKKFNNNQSNLVKSTNVLKKVVGVSTPEKLCVSDKKKLFEKAIKEETENAKRNMEQKLFLSRKKLNIYGDFEQVSSNGSAKKFKETESQTISSVNDRIKSFETNAKLSENKEVEMNAVLEEMKQKSPTKFSNEKSESYNSLVNLKSIEDNDTREKKIIDENEEEYDDVKLEEKNIENDINTEEENTDNDCSDIEEKSMNDSEKEENIQKDEIVLNENYKNECEDKYYESKKVEELEHKKHFQAASEEKLSDNENTINNPILTRNNQETSLYPSLSTMNEKFSPKKQNIQIVNEKVDRPVTPLRTLSMYRREQKMRAAKNCTPLKTSKLLEKHLKEENDYSKWQLYKENLRQKLIDYKTQLEKHDNVIAQTSNAISMCLKSGEFRGSIEQLEAEKILLITTQKRIACLHEIDVIKDKMNSNNFKVPNIPIATGCIKINKITIPLKGDFIVGQVSDQDPLNHYFICLLRCENTVLTTELLSSADSIHEAAICFKNKLEFKDLLMDFELFFEVYGLALPKEKAHHDKKSLLKNSMKITPLSPRLSHKSNKKSNQQVFTYSSNDGFTRLGYVKFDINNILDKKYEFEDFMYNSPFCGQVQCDFKLNADYKFELKDYLNFYEESGTYSVWNRRWCVLKGYLLAYWRFTEDETIKPSIGVIDLKKCINEKVAPVTYETCARKNTFMLVTLQEVSDNELSEHELKKKQQLDQNKIHKTMAVKKHLISTDLEEEMHIWCDKINNLLPLIRVWEEDSLPPKY